VIGPPPYVSVSDALATLLAQAGPVSPQTLPLPEAQGFTLAEPLRCPADQPARAIALREGWAVASHELVGASGYSPVPLAHKPARIGTGEPLPPGADAVLAPEAITGAGDLLEATEAVAPGEGTRRPGEDAAKGAVLREAGRTLRTLDIAIAAGAGIQNCAVRKPTLRLVGREADAATALLAGFARSRGVAVEAAAHWEGAGGGVDLIVIVGPPAPILHALEGPGSVVAARLALRPGERARCGLIEKTPVLWCPARPEVALALALTMVAPCIDRLVGSTEPPCGVQARLTRKISSGLGFAEVALLRRAADGLEPLAVADLTLAAVAAADSWLLVPPESEGFAAGETVVAFPL
jgi:molybdopterin biosynthesis enzyme